MVQQIEPYLATNPVKVQPNVRIDKQKLLDCHRKVTDTEIITLPVRHPRHQFSRHTSFGFLSSRRATNLLCRRCLSGVHSANSNCATSSGRSHTQSFIL